MTSRRYFLLLSYTKIRFRTLEYAYSHMICFRSFTSFLPFHGIGKDSRLRIQDDCIDAFELLACLRCLPSVGRWGKIKRQRRRRCQVPRRIRVHFRAYTRVPQKINRRLGEAWLVGEGSSYLGRGFGVSSHIVSDLSPLPESGAWDVDWNTLERNWRIRRFGQICRFFRQIFWEIVISANSLRILWNVWLSRHHSYQNLWMFAKLFYHSERTL